MLPLSWLERGLGALTGLLGVGALSFTLMQHLVKESLWISYPYTIVGPSGSHVVFGPKVSSVDALTFASTVGLAALAAVLVCVFAWRQTRPSGASERRWGLLVIVAAALGIVAYFLLAFSNLFVAVGGTSPSYVDAMPILNAANIFMPGVVAGLITAVFALVIALRRRQHVPIQSGRQA